MRYPRFAVALCVIALAAPIGRAQTANDLPTIEQLKSQLATDPQAVNLAVTRLMAIKGAAAANYDHYELLMLRGEASLRMKTLPAAADAFEQAQTATTDEKKQDAARANEILLRKSKQSGYIPMPGRLKPGEKPPGPMPIVEDADRKAAMNTLVEDQLRALQPKVTAAKTATALPKLMEAATALDDVRVVEQAATGKTDRVQQPMKEIAGRAHGMIKNALKPMTNVLDEAHANATNRERWTDNTGRKHEQEFLGMNSVHQGKVRDVIDTAGKIEQVARHLAESAGNDPDLTDDAKEAKKFLERGQQLLKNYGPKTK